MIERGSGIAGIAVLFTLMAREPAWAAQANAWITTKATLTLLTMEGVSATDVNV